MGLFARATEASSGNTYGGLPTAAEAAQPPESAESAEPFPADAAQPIEHGAPADAAQAAAPGAPAGTATQAVASGAPAETASPTAAAISAEELAYRIGAIPSGFAAPVLLFGMLRDVLHLKQAALLLLDSHRNVYSPLASVGLDTTSRHRLRFPPEANADFNKAAAGELVIVSGEGLEAFRGYFSSREFSAIRELALVPYLAGRRLVGLLAAGLPQPHDEDTVRLLASTMTAVPPLLVQEPEMGADSGTLGDRVTALLSLCRASRRPLLLMRISLDGFVNLARERFPELEGFRLQEHLVSACRRLLRVIGQVETPKPRLLFLLVHGMKDGDPELLLRQVEAALLSELRGLADTGTVDLQPEARAVTGHAEALSFLAT